MSLNWNSVKPACCAKWLVLPTVYSDALSYGEQLDKFCYQLNQLIENNNILPDFIAEMIKEYINSGAIGEVVRDILADYILNVKYPPEGITPAVGDGSADDTAAIQGCIDYAAENGGVVYFPYGSYLTQPLTMKDGVSLFGFDRYSTKIVLKGGATKPLIGGTVADFSIANLTLDGNSGIQVNDVNVVTIMATNVLFTNLIIKDGYTLVNYVGTGGHFQISDVVFGNAVEKCLVTAGNADVQCENVVFNQLSAVGGVSVMDIGTDGGYFNVKSLATCDKCIVVNSNDNNIVAIVKNSTTPVTDNGLRNNIEIVGVSDKQYFSDDTTKEVNGSYSKHIGGTYTKVVDGNSSESYEGNYSKNVTGVASETYSDSKTVTGKTVVINATNYNVNASGDVSVSGDDIVLDPANPLTYKSPKNLNKMFKYVDFKDSENNVYNVLVNGGVKVSVWDYGATGDGVNDDTVAINNAISSNKGKTILFPCGTYLISEPITVYSNTTLLGLDKNGCVIKLKNASNCNMIESENFGSLINGGSVTQPNKIGICNLSLDGNKDNNNAGHGIALFSSAPYVFNVDVKNVAQRGIHTQADIAKRTGFQEIEGTFSDIYIMFCGEECLYYDGPNDSFFLNVKCVNGSQKGDNSYDNVYFKNSNARICHMHSWNFNDSYGLNRCRYSAVFEDSTGTEIELSHFEGGRTGCLYVKGGSGCIFTGCYFYASFGLYTVLVEGSYHQFVGCKFNGKAADSTVQNFYAVLTYGNAKARAIRVSGDVVSESVFCDDTNNEGLSKYDVNIYYGGSTPILNQKIDSNVYNIISPFGDTDTYHNVSDYRRNNAYNYNYVRRVRTVDLSSTVYLNNGDSVVLISKHIGESQLKLPTGFSGYMVCVINNTDDAVTITQDGGTINGNTIYTLNAKSVATFIATSNNTWYV